MTQPMIYLFMLMLSIVFMQTNHPLAMGLTLLLQALLVSLLTGLFTKTFWFSYILFLIFIGGMLVLFIYVSSLASNEMFTLSSKTALILMSTIILLIMTMMVIDKTSITPHFMNMEMTSTNNLVNLISENSLNLNKLYNAPTNFITLLLIIYLLITLIAIVKITDIYHGPLRPSN